MYIYHILVKLFSSHLFVIYGWTAAYLNKKFCIFFLNLFKLGRVLRKKMCNITLINMVVKFIHKLFHTLITESFIKCRIWIFKLYIFALSGFCNLIAHVMCTLSLDRKSTRLNS